MQHGLDHLILPLSIMMLYARCMRTTITLDKDVAARLRRLRKDRPFKEIVNEALRAGLDVLEEPKRLPSKYVIETTEGRPRRTDLDNIAELIAEVEGDRFR